MWRTDPRTSSKVKLQITAGGQDVQHHGTNITSTLTRRVENYSITVRIFVIFILENVL